MSTFVNSISGAKNKILVLYNPETTQTFGNGGIMCEVSVPDLSKYNTLWIIWRVDAGSNYNIRTIPIDEISNYNDETLFSTWDGGKLSLNLTGNVLKFYNSAQHSTYNYPLTFYSDDEENLPNPPREGTIFFLA